MHLSLSSLSQLFLSALSPCSSSAFVQLPVTLLSHWFVTSFQLPFLLFSLALFGALCEDLYRLFELRLSVKQRQLLFGGSTRAGILDSKLSSLLLLTLAIVFVRWPALYMTLL
jgi:hypothetical protein